MPDAPATLTKRMGPMISEAAAPKHQRSWEENFEQEQSIPGVCQPPDPVPRGKLVFALLLHSCI